MAEEENKSTDSESIATDVEKSVILDESDSQPTTANTSEQKSDSQENNPEEFVAKKEAYL